MFSCSEEEVDCEERNVRARTAKLLLSVQVAGSKTDTSQHWTGLMSHQALMGVFLPFQNQPISTIFIWKFRNPGWNPVEHSTRLLEWWKTSGPKLASLEGLKALRASVLRFAIFFFEKVRILFFVTWFIGFFGMVWRFLKGRVVLQ